jgi:hypothetical protein
MSPTGHHHPLAWSPEGRRLIVSVYGVPKTGVDIVEMDIGTKEVRSLVATPADEGPGGGDLSPDGRWLAYASAVTGTAEVWVMPYGTPGAPVRVSPAGGREPAWAPDGRELYYIEGPRLMAVAVETRTGFRAGAPRTLFEGLVRDSQPPSYAVAPDGRFLIKRVEGAPPPPPITVVQNALASLERGNTP